MFSQELFSLKPLLKRPPQSLSCSRLSTAMASMGPSMASMGHTWPYSWGLPLHTISRPKPFVVVPQMWNSIGVIRCYNDEQDNGIDVEFHDTSIHHTIHLTNTLNHTIADLSQEAVLLACEGTEELAR